MPRSPRDDGPAEADDDMTPGAPGDAETTLVIPALAQPAPPPPATPALAGLDVAGSAAGILDFAWPMARPGDATPIYNHLVEEWEAHAADSDVQGSADTPTGDDQHE